MLLFRLFLLPLFATFALAGIVILQPPPGKKVKPGQHFVVQVEQPNSIQGPIQVALVIGLQACQTHSPSSCNPGEIENLLFNGPFNPQFHHLPGNPVHQPYQNFTVQVPTFMPKGTAVLEVLHVGLIGAGLSLLIETPNVTMHVVG